MRACRRPIRAVPVNSFMVSARAGHDAGFSRLVPVWSRLRCGVGVRVVPVGAQLYAYGIHNIAGVPYARLVPLNPQKPEWVRVAEADHSVEYADVIELTDETVDTSQIAEAIIRLAIAVERLPR